MTGQQKQRISVLIGEIQTILNASGINDEVYINCHRIPMKTMGQPDRSVYEVQMEIMRNEIVCAEKRSGQVPPRRNPPAPRGEL